jgi:glucose/arabinose dehydrogenase
MKVIIKNIHADGNGGAPKGHWTRTLIFDKKGRLYVAVGSNNNIDPDSYRSRIRRFTNFDKGDIDFSMGEIFADGLRNEVGLAFDKFDVLWGVENSADRLRRNDLGGDIHNENPAEELNRFVEGEA